MKFQILGEVSLLYGRPGFGLAFSLWFTIILKAHVLNLYCNIWSFKKARFRAPLLVAT